MFRHLIFATTLLFATQLLTAQTIFDRLHRPDDVLRLELETDLKGLEKLRHDDGKQPATVRFTNAAGSTESYTLNVKARGRFRRQTCGFIPLKLKFNKDTLAARGLADHNDLKLVTHCIHDPVASRAQVVREWLGYQLYQTLTPAAFRAQLVEITYRDPARPRRKIKRYGILIEDPDELAERLGGEKVDFLDGSNRTIDRAHEQFVATFNHFIGNADFGFNSYRNLKLIQPTDGSAAFPVPYDFDFSGLVDPTYGNPNPTLYVSKLRERKFLGDAGSVFHHAALETLHDRQAELLAVVENCRFLTRNERSETVSYLQGFFQESPVAEAVAMP